jgi:hypothetical protein
MPEIGQVLLMPMEPVAQRVVLGPREGTLVWGQGTRLRR